MNIFDFLKDVLYKKKGDLLYSPENEQEFSLYMMQRWLSMHSPHLAKLVNATSNKLYPIFQNKEEQYKMLLSTIPRSNFKKINYIKKSKVDKEKKLELKEVIEFIAKNNQLSQREVKMYVDEFNIDVSNIKQGLNKGS